MIIKSVEVLNDDPVEWCSNEGWYRPLTIDEMIIQPIPADRKPTADQPTLLEDLRSKGILP